MFFWAREVQQYKGDVWRATGILWNLYLFDARDGSAVRFARHHDPGHTRDEIVGFDIAKSHAGQHP